MKEIFFDLIRRSEKGFSNMMKNLLAKFNINLTDYYILSAIEDGHNTVSDISKSEHIIKSSISMCCKCLELKGYIKSVRDSINRRSVILTLTPKTNGLLTEGKVIEDEYKKKIFAGVDNDEFNISKNVFCKLIKNIEDMEDNR